jgi:predicted small lipoprotein YifL
MKKIFALAGVLVMALALLFVLTACGGKTNVKFTSAAADAEPEGFIAVAGKDGKVYYQIGVDTYEDLYATFNIQPDKASYVNVFVKAENDEKYPYLYPEKKGWNGYITADTSGSWFDSSLQKGVVTAFNEWKDTVYSKFDYKAIRVATPDKIVANSPPDDYVVTQDDIDMFMTYARIGGAGRLNGAIDQELGKTVGESTYDYLKVNVADKIRNKANVGTLLKNMGITNTGGVQESFGSILAGTYFDFKSDNWAQYDDILTLVKQFIAKGMTFSNASDNMNRLHAINGGRILYEASTNETSNDNAFAIVVGKDGKTYWKAGIDYCDLIYTVFSLTGEDYVNLQVMPAMKDGVAGTYDLPDGLNPEVTRHFIYFEDSKAVTWELTVRGGAELPSWFTDKMKQDVMAAFEEWKTEVFSHIDLDAALAIFPESTKDVKAYTDADVALLKEYVTIVNDLKAKGTSVNQVISQSVNDVVGSTILGEFGAWANAKWRLIHTDCSQPCIKIGYLAYHNIVDTKTEINADVESVSAAAAFKGITWTYQTAKGGYPIQSLLDLTNKGLICYSDGEYWYITSGEGCDVLLAITEADLLK